MAAPSTTYIWDNSGSAGTLGYFQNYVYGPYTVGKTGWYQIKSRWAYIQAPQSVSGTDQGIGTVWMQINTSSTNSMDALNDPSVTDEPVDETVAFNRVIRGTMLPGKMIYLTSGTNYFIHILAALVDRYAEQKFILNYVQ